MDDTQRLLKMHKEKHDFPGMLGSLDCMHWVWKNCPKAHAAAYTRGDQGVSTLILEAVASQDLWIWHAFFGVAGSNNDINVLNASPLFEDTFQGIAPAVKFKVNGSTYRQWYYLADGIYPDWPVFGKTLPPGVEPDKRRFSKMQEAARKDVERAFGVLQSRWHIMQKICNLYLNLLNSQLLCNVGKNSNQIYVEMKIATRIDSYDSLHANTETVHKPKSL